MYYYDGLEVSWLIYRWSPMLSLILIKLMGCLCPAGCIIYCAFLVDFLLFAGLGVSRNIAE